MEPPDPADAQGAYASYRDALRAGHAAVRTGRHDDAAVAYRRAADIAPGRAAPWIGLGQVELARRRAAAAAAAFATALTLDPGDPTAAVGRATALAARPTDPTRSMRRRRRRRASTTASEAATVRTLAADWDRALGAEDVDALLEVAVALGRLGRLDAATDVARDAVRLRPRHLLAYQVLAWFEIARGRPGAAGATAALVDRLDRLVDDPLALEVSLEVALEARDVPAMLAVADAHRRRHRPRLAIEIGHQALRLAPTDPDVYLSIARARLDLGLRAAVIVDLDRLVRLLEVVGDTEGRRRVGVFVARSLRTAPSRPRPA